MLQGDDLVKIESWIRSVLQYFKNENKTIYWKHFTDKDTENMQSFNLDHSVAL